MPPLAASRRLSPLQNRASPLLGRVHPGIVVTTGPLGARQVVPPSAMAGLRKKCRTRPPPQDARAGTDAPDSGPFRIEGATVRLYSASGVLPAERGGLCDVDRAQRAEVDRQVSAGIPARFDPHPRDFLTQNGPVDRRIYRQALRGPPDADSTSTAPYQGPRSIISVLVRVCWTNSTLTAGPDLFLRPHGASGRGIPLRLGGHSRDSARLASSGAPSAFSRLICEIVGSSSRLLLSLCA